MTLQSDFAKRAAQFQAFGYMRTLIRNTDKDHETKVKWKVQPVKIHFPHTMDGLWNCTWLKDCMKRIAKRGNLM